VNLYCLCEAELIEDRIIEKLMGLEVFFAHVKNLTLSQELRCISGFR